MPHDLNWRREITSRVQQHRARRRRPGDTDVSMEFDFPPQEAFTVTEEPVIRERMFRRLAGADFRGDELGQTGPATSAEPASTESPKVIRFPRSLTATASEPLIHEQPIPDLLEPVADVAPRIMDVAETEPTLPTELLLQAPDSLRQAEQMELLPSFEDIHLEAGHVRADSESEVIPRPAPLQQRLIGGLVDFAVVGSAAALFEFAFRRLAEDDPHSRMALMFALLVSGILWILFQYLFLVHGEGTPGMRFAQLELVTFEGKPVSADARRWRAMASTLSAVSVGLGYAWALVDEDRLGWHDRITGTLLHSSAEQSTRGTEVWTDFISGM
jgi:uncharacterized RDD family membrane protein YckC